jgi:hypothetical protein
MSSDSDQRAGPEDESEGPPPEPRDAKGPARKPFLLRVSPELLDELRGWANQEFRSLNGQIEYLLQEAVRRRRKAE